MLPLPNHVFQHSRDGSLLYDHISSGHHDLSIALPLGTFSLCGGTTRSATAVSLLQDHPSFIFNPNFVLFSSARIVILESSIPRSY